MQAIKPTVIEDLDETDPAEIDTFSESFAPVNHAKHLLFRLRDKVCCVGLLFTVAVCMRFFLAK